MLSFMCQGQLGKLDNLGKLAVRKKIRKPPNDKDDKITAQLHSVQSNNQGTFTVRPSSRMALLC